METIKVNMNPNPLDAQTIHASQNDGEARQWEFELHNNGELIDTSDVKEQLVFKAYKGGTEQLLPKNTSTPTTSPFKGDIRYPQGLLTDQEFTYRQSPTEEDGLAKIKNLYGNTLVWNQIFIPQYRSGSGIQAGPIQDGNDYSMKIWGTATANAWLRMDATGTLPVGHKFLLDKGSTSDLFDINNDNNGLLVDFSAKTKIGTITTADKYLYIFVNNGTTIDITVKPILIDLTKMFGEGNEPSTVEEFTSLFPLSYYSYNQGSLLSFNGSGIKTVGFNQWDEEWEVGAYNSADGSKADNVRDRIRNKNPIRIFPSVNYYKNKGLQVYYYDASMNFIGWNSLANQGIFTPPSNACYMNFNGLANSGTTYNHDICINISSSRDGEYEPYTSSTLSLPISTYFPNGMDGVGTAYDELTSSKATTRMDRIDLGSIAYIRNESQTSGVYFFVGTFRSIPNIKVRPNSVVWNIKTPLYETVPSSEIYYGRTQDKTIGGYDAQTVRIRDDSFTDATAFKNSLSGQYLVYELATESETSFTTASLVTENAEIPLSNEDGVLIGKCTEQLSENPGFFDAKIKLADTDGECYSNKIQLHVERSPQ